jgi:hypothetical protein
MQRLDLKNKSTSQEPELLLNPEKYNSQSKSCKRRNNPTKRTNSPTKRTKNNAKRINITDLQSSSINQTC